MQLLIILLFIIFVVYKVHEEIEQERKRGSSANLTYQSQNYKSFRDGNVQQLEEKLKLYQGIEQRLNSACQDLSRSQEKLQQSQQTIVKLEKKLQLNEANCLSLSPDSHLIDGISQYLKCSNHDQGKLQCTGIDESNFYVLEEVLTNFLEQELSGASRSQLSDLKAAVNDIREVKSGRDPKYDLRLTPHAYFLQYFLDNVYCSYIAWFLTYEVGLLQPKLNVLDVAAGPGTVAYGLALFLQSSRLFKLEQLHVSYLSLEKQKLFQDYGLQLWNRYTNSLDNPLNLYLQFKTADLFDYQSYRRKLPSKFFNFIIISHCLFADFELRNSSYDIYRKMFKENLAKNGHVLLIVQGAKLFKSYQIPQTESLHQEKELIEEFTSKLGLRVERYKYVTSTGKRGYMHNFSQYAEENLPDQLHLNLLKRHYLGASFNSNYALDDYIILARLES